MTFSLIHGKHYDESPSECWIWSRGKVVGGYGRVRFGGKLWLAHRLVYSVMVGEIPDGLFVLHTCDTPACVNPRHLFLGTQQDNYDDMRRKGRDHKAQGSSKPNASLTDEQVREMVSAFRAGTARHGEFVRKFGVSRGVVSGIKNRRSWRHIWDE